MENLKFLYLDQMEEFKSADDHIREAREFLENYKMKLEKVMTETKKEHVKNLQQEIKMHWKAWKKSYNEEMVKKHVQSGSIEKLEFEDKEFVNKAHAIPEKRGVRAKKQSNRKSKDQRTRSG